MKKFSLFLVVILLITTRTTVSAETVTLSWDPNDDADYYVVYWGENSGEYTDESEAVYAPMAEYTTPDLPIGTWYLAVKAFNACGNSSDFSDEVSKTIESSGTIDSDNDGLTDEEEAELGSNPDVADTDGDGINDGAEVSLGTNPLLVDTDGDGVDDKEEIVNGTDPLTADVVVTVNDFDCDGDPDETDPDDDNDGIEDVWEIGDVEEFYNPNFTFVDRAYIDGTLVELENNLCANSPALKVSPTNSEGYQIFFSSNTYWAKKIIGPLGNLDGENGEEVAFSIENRESGELSVIIIDVESGNEFNFGEVIETSTLCESLEVIDRQFVNGDLVELGYCSERGQTIARVHGTTVSEIDYLESGEIALGFQGIDTDGDGTSEIVVFSAENTVQIKKITGVTIAP